MQELEEEARRKAQEARLAFATAAGGDNASIEPRPFEDEVMEALEQGKAAIGKIWVSLWL